MIDEREIAAGLFRGLFGEEPPKPRPWKLIARPHSGDPEQPLYEVDRDNWIVYLNLHPGQMAAWNADRRFVFMLAGTQGGKTSFLPWLLAREVLEDEIGGDYLAVTATFDLFQLKFLPAMREVFEEVLDIARHWGGPPEVLELRNPKTGEFEAEKYKDKMWGRIILRSAHAKGGLESATAKAAILDECGQDTFTYHAWQAIRRRLALARGRAWGGTTLYNLGWLKQKIYDLWERKQLPDTDIVQFSSLLNPAFSKEEFADAQKSMQDHEFLMQYEGKYGRPAAAIFKDFIDQPKHEGGHKVKRFEIPREWARYQAVDPGIIHTAKLWAAHDPQNDVYYVYRSTMHERKPATEHAQDDLKLEAQHGERVVLRAIGAKSETYWREDYKKAGAQGGKEPDTNDVEEGIDRIVTMLKQHRIYFFDDETELIREMLEYAREVDDLGNAMDEIKDKSKFHRVDTVRYLCIQLVKPRSTAKSSTGARSYVG